MKRGRTSSFSINRPLRGHFWRRFGARPGSSRARGGISLIIGHKVARGVVLRRFLSPARRTRAPPPLPLPPFPMWMTIIRSVDGRVYTYVYICGALRETPIFRGFKGSPKCLCVFAAQARASSPPRPRSCFLPRFALAPTFDPPAASAFLSPAASA